MEENEIPASHSDKDREINVTRRVFITAVGRLGALLAVGSSVLAGETYGQSAPGCRGTSACGSCASGPVVQCGNLPKGPGEVLTEDPYGQCNRAS
jgi:hypothetical protein